MRILNAFPASSDVMPFETLHGNASKCPTFEFSWFLNPHISSSYRCENFIVTKEEIESIDSFDPIFSERIFC